MADLHSVKITLPLPPRALSPNTRSPGNWRKKQRATKKYRADAYLMTLAAGGQNLKWTKAIAQATFYWSNKARRDVRNAEAMLKPAYDGIVDAGLIVDDNYEVLTHYPTAFFVDEKRPRVEIMVFKVSRDVDAVVDARALRS